MCSFQVKRQASFLPVQTLVDGGGDIQGNEILPTIWKIQKELPSTGLGANLAQAAGD